MIHEVYGSVVVSISVEVADFQKITGLHFL
jgi:hypothetical protein